MSDEEVDEMQDTVCADTITFYFSTRKANSPSTQTGLVVFNSLFLRPLLAPIVFRSF